LLTTAIDITLITPPESAPPLLSALATNPHLTSLPTPKPEVVAPKDLDITTGTGEIFRLPEVVKAITGDFIVLPCDLICEVDGSDLVETWMTLEAGLGGASGGLEGGVKADNARGGERNGRRGGMGVWFPTKGLEGISTKRDETDFLATAPIPPPTVPVPDKFLRRNIEQVVLSIPSSTVKDITEEHKSLPIRHMLVKKHGNVKMKMNHRDAHIYILPYWALEMMQLNEFDSIAEDVLGWWAKASWQEGLAEKMGLRGILDPETKNEDADDMMMESMTLEDDIDLAGMSSTSIRTAPAPPALTPSLGSGASRIPASVKAALKPQKSITIPPLLAYVQPPFTAANVSTQPLIRRVDTTSLLLSVSLRLAKLPSIAECIQTGATPSHLAHTAKVAHPDMVQAQSRISESDSLVAENVTIGSRVNIKESVIGVGCTIGTGSRLTRCLLMDGVTVGDFVTLTGCILGRRCKIVGGQPKDEDKTKLTDCEVQSGYVVEWGSKYLLCTYLDRVLTDHSRNEERETRGFRRS